MATSVAAGVLTTGPAVDTADADWDAVFDVNAGGVFRCSRAVARRMVPRRRGVIVTVGSNAAGVPRSRMAAYAASKAAAAQFTRCLGLELAEFGIRCNVVAPGSTDTPMLRGMWHGPDDRDATLRGDPDRYRVGIPLGRLAEPDDVADAVVFLASDRARHITLHDLYVPASAEIVLEGYIYPDEVAVEGPFGDHTGYYNSVEKFPVFKISAITMRLTRTLMLTPPAGRSKRPSFSQGRRPAAIWSGNFAGSAASVDRARSR